MAESVDLRAAVAAVCPGGRLVEAVTLEGGSSAFVARLRLADAAGQRRDVVFRQHADRAVKEHGAGVAEKELRLLAHLADEGLAVPRPLALDDGNTSGGPWLVTEWVEGSTGDDRIDLDEALPGMASFLAQLHAVDPSALDGQVLDRVEDPLRALPAYLADDPLGHSIRDALAGGPVGSGAGDAARRPNADVIVHGDYWPGNLLFRGDELVAVLDWEDAALGDPLVDLAVARLELTCAYGEPAAGRFTSHYLDAAGRLDLADLPLWEVYVSATALATMHRWGLPPDDEARRRAVTRSFCAATVDALAKR